MKITIIQVGETPVPMRGQFGRYPEQFHKMFRDTRLGFEFETVRVLDGEALPRPHALEAILITGSAMGVYDTPDWMDPLRAFIGASYAAKIPMLGVCFGHQIMADALGGDVRKSDKGWSVGRHVYQVAQGHGFMSEAPGEVAIAASHQDQVIAPPPDAKVFLSSSFTPNAGLIYKNGAAISVQPHPEFDLDFSSALVELRRNNPLTDTEVELAKSTLDAPLDSADVAIWLGRFLKLSAQ